MIDKDLKLIIVFFIMVIMFVGFAFVIALDNTATALKENLQQEPVICKPMGDIESCQVGCEIAAKKALGTGGAFGISDLNIYKCLEYCYYEFEG